MPPKNVRPAASGGKEKEKEKEKEKKKPKVKEAKEVKGKATDKKAKVIRKENPPEGTEPLETFFADLADEDFFGDRVQHVYFYDDVTYESVERLKETILDLNRSDRTELGVTVNPKPIVVHVNSPGGSVFDGMRMRTVFRESRVPICVLTDGVSYSAGTFLSVLAPYRVMCRYSTVMLHDYSAMVVGKRGDFLFETQTIEHVWGEIKEAYLRHTRLGAKQLDALMQRDLYLGAATCAKAGICNRVIEPRWRGASAYFKRNPQYKMPYPVLLKKTNLNHVRFECSDEFNLQSVVEVDRILQTARGSLPFVKPVVFHVDSARCHMYPLMQTVPILHRVLALPVPTVAVISSVMSVEDMLPALFCSKRVMYEHAKVYINFLKAPSGEMLLQDVIDNTKYVFGMLMSILRERTRIPAEVLRSLDRKRVLLSAAECKKYDLVDEVIKL